MKNKEVKDPIWKQILVGVSIIFIGALLIAIIIDGKSLPWTWFRDNQAAPSAEVLPVAPPPTALENPNVEVEAPPALCPHQVYVIDKQTQAPVSGALVVVPGLEERITSHMGIAQLAVPPEKSNSQQATISVSKDGKIGQVTAALCDGNDTTIEIQ